MTPGDRRRADVLRFWRDVELLNPPAVARVDPARRRYRVEPDGMVPWEPGHELHRRHRPPSNRFWRYTVHLGIYRLDTTRKIVEDQLGADPESHDRRPLGESALAMVAVAHDGVLIPESAVLSSAAWASGQIAAGNFGRLDGFDRAEARLNAAIRELAGDEPLTSALLARCAAAAASVAGVEGLLDAGEIRIHAEYVPEALAREPDAGDFLNSFFPEDLAKVARAWDGGDVGRALRRYLTNEDEAAAVDRIDVRDDLDAVIRATQPAEVPGGRWPAASDQPLALGQQLAVDRMLAMAGSGGLFGVNGPPGTGKTTMLRDVIAALVVERARRLARLSRPSDAFLEEPARWRSDGIPRTVQRWRPELTGFEIVVASSNNGAVENVTRDIPGRQAIDRSWDEAVRRLDHFAEVASELLDRDSWGLIAAPLGRKANRQAFVRRCFWGGNHDDGPEGLFAYLSRLEKEPGPSESWATCVEAFQRAATAVDRLQADRAAAHDALAREP
ncbi:MAG TPA: hypothetical protein VN238_13705, partial [Solirubrobacteraceae bacterium]|nr:hypothetical protein [Solirubrobacteraceae bacterium]